MLTCESFADLEALFLRHLKLVVCLILKPIFSLRSSDALECLNFFGDVGLHLGAKMNNFMVESILTQLIQCCATSKKIVLKKTNEVINTFLINTHFNLRMITIVCNNMQQKNITLRNSAALALKTILEHHGQKAKEKLVPGKGEASLLQKSIQKGISDASSEVRKTCRDILVVYKNYWPKEAESARPSKNNEAPGLSKSIKRKSTFPIEGSSRLNKKTRHDSNSAKAESARLSKNNEAPGLSKSIKRKSTFPIEGSSRLNKKTRHDSNSAKAERAAKNDEAVVEKLKVNNTIANGVSKTETIQKLYTSKENPVYEKLSPVAQCHWKTVHNCIAIMQLGDERLLSSLELRKVLESSAIVDIYKIDQDSAFWLCDFACDFRSYL
ncbi:clasp N terminal-domain-containing protein, partial [Sporodiniella umbellata]